MACLECKCVVISSTLLRFNTVMPVSASTSNLYPDPSRYASPSFPYRLPFLGISFHLLQVDLSLPSGLQLLVVLLIPGLEKSVHFTVWLGIIAWPPCTVVLCTWSTLHLRSSSGVAPALRSIVAACVRSFFAARCKAVFPRSFRADATAPACSNASTIAAD